MTNAKQEREWLRGALTPTNDCLSLADMEVFAGSEAPSSAAQAHLEKCPHCQTELALLRTFQEAAPVAGEGAAAAWIAAQLERAQKSMGSADRRPVRSRWFAWPRLVLVSAAALAVVAVVVTLGIQWRSQREPELRAGVIGSNATYRSSSIHALAPAGDTDAAVTAFRWEAVQGATQYKVTVMEVDHAIIWSGTTQQPTLGLSREVRRIMRPGKSLLWQVVALDGAGRALGESDVIQFRASQPTKH